jgi:hypothetical protein
MESTQGGIASQVWPSHHNLGVLDYEALTGLSLLRVPHFCARRGASLKVIHPDTMSMSITKCFLVSRGNMRKHTNVGKSLDLRIARVIYRVRQITHRAITRNKRHLTHRAITKNNRDLVIVTMHT